MNPFAWDTYLAQASSPAAGLFDELRNNDGGYQPTIDWRIGYDHGVSLKAMLRQVLEVTASITGALLPSAAFCQCEA